MPSSAALLAKSEHHVPAYLETIRETAKRDIAPAVGLIDEGKLYPADILKDLGAAGAWRQHLDVMNTPDILSAIEGIGAIGEVCGATAFSPGISRTPPTLRCATSILSQSHPADSSAALAFPIQ